MNKYIKLFMALCLPALIISCKDDKEIINTGAATIAFQESTVSIKESISLLQLPITVTGDHNGLIKINVTMKSNNANFTKDKDVIITSESLFIPVGSEQINMEVALDISNDEIIDGRYIIFEITNAEGASLGSNKTITIDIKENNILEGKYTLKGFNVFDNKETTYNCQITAVEGSPDKMLIDFGLGGTAEMYLTGDPDSMEYDVSIAPMQNIGKTQGYDVLITWLNAENDKIYYSPKEPIVGEFKNKVITLESGLGFMASQNGSLEGWMDGWKQGTITLTKNSK